MLIGDVVIAIVFTVIVAVALFKSEDKIAEWQKEISKR